MAELRLATATDLASIERCARLAYSMYTERIGREPAPMVADFAGQISDGLIHVVEEDQHGLCGYVVLYPIDHFMMLENVAVRPDRQGYGYGRLLIDFVEERTRQAGLSAVRLYTNIHMRENIGLYRALGYLEIDRRREEGFDRVYFEKRLGA